MMVRNNLCHITCDQNGFALMRIMPLENVNDNPLITSLFQAVT